MKRIVSLGRDPRRDHVIGTGAAKDTDLEAGLSLTNDTRNIVGEITGQDPEMTSMTVVVADIEIETDMIEEKGKTEEIEVIEEIETETGIEMIREGSHTRGKMRISERRS